MHVSDYPRAGRRQTGCDDACKASMPQFDIWEELCHNIVDAVLGAEHVLTDAKEVRHLLVGDPTKPCSGESKDQEESQNTVDRIRRATNRIKVVLHDIEEEIHMIANGVK